MLYTMNNIYESTTTRIPSQYSTEVSNGGADGDTVKVSISLVISHKHIQRVCQTSDYTTRQILEVIRSNPELLNLHRSLIIEINDILRKIHNKDPFAEVYDVQYRKSLEKTSTQYALEA